MLMPRPDAALAFRRSNKCVPPVAERCSRANVDDISKLAFPNDERQHRSAFLARVPHRTLQLLASVKAPAGILVTTRTRLGEVDALAFVGRHPFGGHSTKEH